MKKILFLIFLCCFLCNSYSGFSQALQDTSYYRIETVDGNTYIGRIFDEDAEMIRFLTDNIGEISILKKNITSRTIIDQNRIRDGNYWFENPQASRYFWQPNGYSLRRGEGYYQNVWIFLNQVYFGISNNLSLGVGLVPAFFLGASAAPVWITPKFSIPVVPDKFNVGGGALVGTVLGEEGTGFGVLYGVTTFGSRDKNLSFGLGWGYSGSEGLANLPTISLSAMARTGARGYIMSENYYIGMGNSGIALISLGGRQILRKVGLDYGGILPIASFIDSFIFIPWLGITIPFGNAPESQVNIR
jgi:hypothetical protein